MSFSVVINTENAVDTTVVNAVRDYNIDWSRFEEGEYKLSFSFESGFQEEDAFGLNYLPHMLSLPDLPLKNVVCAIGGRTQSSSGVGLIQFRPLGDQTYDFENTTATFNNSFPSGQYYFSNPSNKPVSCLRPSSQNFRVRFLGHTGEVLPFFVPYTLMLYFTKL